MANGMIPVGRPRVSVDFAIVLRMRDVEKMGWLRMAEVYREITGRYISRDTIKRRYLEVKAQKTTSTKIPLK
jgi:hypothetical protein